MASRAPASCSPWAMDHAMLRLLATPNTTATRPSRLKDIHPPGEREKHISGAGGRASSGFRSVSDLPDTCEAFSAPEYRRSTQAADARTFVRTLKPEA